MATQLSANKYGENLLSDPSKPYNVYGHVEPGFEGVLEKFQYIYDIGIDKNSQLCIYYQGRKVVDIWGETPGYVKDSKFNGNTLMNIYSSGKVLGSIMTAIMYD